MRRWPLIFLITAVHGTPPRLPITVINLDKDTERLKTVLAQLEKKGVPLDVIERQPAVLGAALDASELRRRTTLLARMFATRGMIGCYLSHVDFWRRTMSRTDACLLYTSPSPRDS